MYTNARTVFSQVLAAATLAGLVASSAACGGQIVDESEQDADEAALAACAPNVTVVGGVAVVSPGCAGSGSTSAPAAPCAASLIYIRSNNDRSRVQIPLGVLTDAKCASAYASFLGDYNRKASACDNLTAPAGSTVQVYRTWREDWRPILPVVDMVCPGAHPSVPAPGPGDGQCFTNTNYPTNQACRNDSDCQASCGATCSCRM